MNHHSSRKNYALALLGLSVILCEPALAQVCDPWPAADTAGKLTTATVNAFTGLAVFAATAEETLALQGAASQISGNIRGLITGAGLIAEAKSNQDTQRGIQGDRVAAVKAHQFSTPLCQAATGANISIALAHAAQPDQILVARANAHRTAGIQRPESSTAASLAGVTAFQERQALFCAPNDPACKGVVGRRPDGDRMPGALFAVGRLETADDRAQAAWQVNNLTMPSPVPALTGRQMAQPGGPELYMRRGGWETQVNLAKDLTADILLTRRTPKADRNYYNQLAAEAGLPQSPDFVSQTDMDRMQFRDRLNDKYSTRIAQLGDSTVLFRELAALKAGDIQQTYRLNQLLEQGLLLNSGVLSSLVEPKLHTTAGK